MNEIQNEDLQKKYTILKRERAINDEANKKVFSSIMAATCIINASVEVYFSGSDINDVIKNELSKIYSWDKVEYYFQDLSPIITLLGSSATNFITKSFKYDKKYLIAKQKFEDMNELLQNKLSMEELNNA